MSQPLRQEPTATWEDAILALKTHYDDDPSLYLLGANRNFESDPTNQTQPFYLPHLPEDLYAFPDDDQVSAPMFSFPLRKQFPRAV